MVVLIVTSSMRRPPLNCSISGLEDLASVMTEKEYLRLAETLSLTSEPFPGQQVFTSRSAAQVLTTLTDLRFQICSQSQDSQGLFITWTLFRSQPTLIRRNHKDVKVFQANVETAASMKMFEENAAVGVDDSEANNNKNDRSNIFVRRNYHP